MLPRSSYPPGVPCWIDLVQPDPQATEAFYRDLFGWEANPLAMGDGGGTWMFRVPGYGDFLAESDPELRERQASEQAPEGFADAVAMMTTSDGPTR